jgi:hypothetical protein
LYVAFLDDYGRAGFKTVLLLKTGPIGCKKTSMTKYETTPIKSAKSEVFNYRAAEDCNAACNYNFIKYIDL